MSGSLVSNYSISDNNIQNVELTLDQTFKGKQDAVTISEIATSTVPEITAGSTVENNGALYKFTANEAISTTDPVTSATVADGTVYICLIPAATTITAAFTATAPTWDDAKQGYYGTGAQANYRYLPYYMTKSGTSYSNKLYLAENKSMNIGINSVLNLLNGKYLANFVNYASPLVASPSFTVSGLESGTWCVIAHCTMSGAGSMAIREGGTGGTVVSSIGTTDTGFLTEFGGFGIINGTSFSFTTNLGTITLKHYIYFRIA